MDLEFYIRLTTPQAMHKLGEFKLQHRLVPSEDGTAVEMKNLATGKRDLMFHADEVQNGSYNWLFSLRLIDYRKRLDREARKAA